MNWVERPACSDGPLRALVRTLELAVVPRHDAIGADPHAEALRPALVDERADLVGDLTEVPGVDRLRSEEHTSELQSLMRISYAVFCLKNNNKTTNHPTYQ